MPHTKQHANAHHPALVQPLNPLHIPILTLYYLWEKGPKEMRYKWSSLGIPGVATFDLENDEYGPLHIKEWLLATIPEPTIKELSAYSWVHVEKWYHTHYVLPEMINRHQPIFPRVSAEDLGMLRSHLDDIVDGAFIFNTTTRRLNYFVKAQGVWHAI